MRIRFDYLQGPVLGHKRRCEILQHVLETRGHILTDYSSYLDFLIVDYPEESIPEPIDETPRLLMGTLPRLPQDHAWHALGPRHERTLTGREYLILDPRLANFRGTPKLNDLLITCGGSDPYHLTEILLSQDMSNFSDVAVVLGPNFGRVVNVPPSVKVLTSLDYITMLETMSLYRQIICAWGTTAFESMYLGAHVIPITLYPDHQAEAKRLGCSYVTQEEAKSAFSVLKRITSTDYSIDLEGTKRLCLWLEDIFWKREGKKLSGLLKEKDKTYGVHEV